MLPRKIRNGLPVALMTRQRRRYSMKLFRLLIIVPALFLQIGCGSNNSNPNGSYYMGTNGTCMSTGGQAVPTSYCSSAYGAGAISQSCVGIYQWCPNGSTGTGYSGYSGGGSAGCQTGQCYGSNCSGYTLINQSGQSVRCL